MISIVFSISYFLILAGIVMGFVRLILGKSTLDRLLAFDYLSICILALIAVYSMKSQTAEFLELIMLFSLIGFSTTVVFMEIFFTSGENYD